MSKYPLMAERPVDGMHFDIFEKLYASGVRMFHLDATCAEDHYHPQLRAWVAPDRFDYSFQENYWRELIKRCPDAKLCLRIYVASPPWWDEAHPDELQRYADGRVEHEYQRTQRKTLPSLASEIWRRDASESLKRYLAWIGSSGWGDRVWGIFLGYGITWEWGILGSDDFIDYSKPMRERFRRWLRETYRDDMKQLRDAWGDADVSFESADIPSPEARLRGEEDFRVFPRDRASFDFQTCLSDVNAEYLLTLAKTVRESAGKKYQLGTFYGYTLTAREHTEFTGRYGAGGLQGGHHAFGKVLDAKVFDFVASPYAYGNRDLGSGLLIQHFPLASAQHHGLHAYDENDLWTFTTSPQEAKFLSRGNTKTREDSVQHQRLAFMQAMCRGTSWWWTELTEWVGPYAENYSDPAILKEIREQVGLYESLGGKRKSRSAAQIAIVIDERAIAALALSSKLFLREVYDQWPAWAWCGAPFDVWLASDATVETMRPYRLVYMFAPWQSLESRTKLCDALSDADRTVWRSPGSDRGMDHAVRARGLRGVQEMREPAAGKSAAQLAVIARKAGVHLYAPAPIQILASDRFIGVHARDAGVYRIKLRLDQTAHRWRDIISGKVLEASTLRFEQPNGVALLCREDH